MLTLNECLCWVVVRRVKRQLLANKLAIYIIVYVSVVQREYSHKCLPEPSLYKPGRVDWQNDCTLTNQHVSSYIVTSWDCEDSHTWNVT